MLCPICKSELIVTGQEKLETLSEHVSQYPVSLKSKYECSNENCESKNHIFWNHEGDLYTEFDFYSDDLEKLNFIDNNNAPFGSLQRQLNIEVYKDDENWTIYKGKNWHFVCEYSYKADENGNILSRKKRLRIWKRRDDFWINYIPGIKMFIFSVRQFHNNVKSYIKNQNSWDLQDIEYDVNSYLQNDELWRKCARTYKKYILKYFYPTIFSMVKIN